MSTRTRSSTPVALAVAATALFAFAWAAFGSLAPASVIAAAGLTAVAVAARVGVSRVLRFPAAVPLGCVGRVFRHVPLKLVGDAGRLVVAALRGGPRGGRPAGAYLAYEIAGPAASAPALAARGSLVLGLCAAPNSVALGFAADGRSLRVHRLVPAPPPADPSWPL